MNVDDRYQRIAGLVFRLTYGDLGDHAGALAFANMQMKHNASAEAFVQMAGAIAADERATSKELAAAEKFAKHANELAKQEAPGPHAALGKLAMRRGDRAEAAKFQRRAVELTSDPDERAEAEKVLKGYEE